MLSTSLPWLPELTEEQRLTLKQTASLENLIRISNSKLSTNQLGTISKKLKNFSAQEFQQNNIQNYKLGILSNATYDLINDALVGSALRYGINLSLCVPDFDQVFQQSIDHSSEINLADLDGVLIAQDYRALGFKTCLNDSGAKQSQVKDRLDRLRTCIESLKKKTPRTIIVQTIALPPSDIAGNANLAIEGTQSDLIQSYNAGLIELARQSELVLFDVSSLANSVGLSNWFDSRMWHHAKIPFRLDAVPLYCDHLLRLVAALKGLSRKCLILDLDNTVWGGVIGDDGMHGIQLGNGSAEGEAFIAIQKMALDLKERGIVLAVCSKNTEEIAKEPFEKHPEMLLKLEHIASFKANWLDKASNIRNIAQELNLGLDAMVFLDDNPAERAQVRHELPMVAVPEVGKDPALYPDLVLSGGYFETLSLTNDDLIRASSYQVEKERQNLANQASDMETYLRNLKMEISFDPINEMNLTRSTQLINKTNQFNLMTQRYSEEQVIEFMRDENTHTFTARLKDTFGEYGLISVIICKKTAAHEWFIDTWLMSCRVLKRRVEEAVLDYLIREAEKSGINTLVGKFIETKKNKLVRDHYRDLGFSYNEQKDVYVLEINTYTPFSPPISCISG